MVGEYKSAPETTWSYRFNELEEAYDVEVSDKAKAANLKSTLPTAIMEALSNAGGEGATVQELGEALSMSDYMIREGLKTLTAQDKVHRTKGKNPPGVSGPKPIIYISQEI